MFQHASSTSARWLITTGQTRAPLHLKLSALISFRGRVAVCLTPSPDRVEGEPIVSSAPIQTGLPVHINGAFAVSSNRRQLWKSGGDEAGTGSWKGEWNTFLIKSLLPALYSESVALCAQLWRCGLGPPDAPRSWLFDATWPRPRTRGDVDSGYFRIVADEMIMRSFSEMCDFKIFMTAVPDQQILRQRAAEHKRRKKKKKKKKHCAAAQPGVVGMAHSPEKLSEVEGYTWVTSSRAVFMDSCMRQTLDSTTPATKEALQKASRWRNARCRCSRMGRRIIWLRNNLQTLGKSVHKALWNGPWSRVRHFVPVLQCVHGNTKKSLLEDTGTLPLDSIGLKPSDLKGLKLVPLRRGRMGTFHAKSPEAPIYVMAPEEKFDCLLGNYHLVVDTGQSTGLTWFSKLTRFIPAFHRTFNVEILSPELLVTTIGLGKCLPPSWEGRRCVECCLPGSQETSGRESNSLCPIDKTALGLREALADQPGKSSRWRSSEHSDRCKEKNGSKGRKLRRQRSSRKAKAGELQPDFILFQEEQRPSSAISTCFGHFCRRVQMKQ